MAKRGSSLVRRALTALAAVICLCVSLPVQVVAAGQVAASAKASPQGLPKIGAASSVVQSGASSWGWSNPRPQGNHLQAISCSSATNCTAGGDAGTIIATTDGGSTWAGQHAGPGSDYFNNQFRGVACPTATSCLAVEGAGIEGTSDGGATWTQQSTLSSFSVSCASATACVATISNGSVAVTTDAGAHWSSRTTTTGLTLQAISCPDINTCYAAAYGVIVKTTDGGNTWTSTGAVNYPFLFSGISCPTATGCFAVGTQGIYATTDGGTTWVQRVNTSGPGNRVTSISCPGPTTCFAGGPFGIIVSTTDGTTWNTHTVNGSPDGISCPATTTCTVVGLNGGIQKTSDGGGTWTAQNSGPTSALFDASCATASTCVVVGGGYYYNEPGAILTTTDRGATWVAQQRQLNQRLDSVSCPTTSLCLAVGFDSSSTGGNAAVILRSTDGGASWSPQSLAFTATYLFGVSCSSASTCVAVGRNEILTTTDGGATWTLRSPAATLLAVSCPSPTTCYAVGSQGEIIATKDGQTWTAQNSRTSAYLSSISCPTASTCYALSPQGAVFDTVDGGSNWNNGGYVPQQVIRCWTATSCVAVGNRDLAYQTSNGGATWSTEEIGTNNQFWGLSCSASGSCLAVGSYGSILSRVAPSRAVARPRFVAADGTSASTITVTVRDAFGEPASGKTVTVAQTAGPAAATISPASAVTDAAGEAMFAATASAPGTDTFTATDVTDAATIGQTPSMTFLANPVSALSGQQYAIRNNDGASWSDIDPVNLSLRVTPAVDSWAILGGNIDLWTANAGYNQDVGIAISGGTGNGTTYPTTAGQPEGWKESGGFAGTFSPNAAFVQTMVLMKAGSTYTVTLQWKANKPAVGATLFAGAGPIGADYSPARLTAQLVPMSSGLAVKASSVKQYLFPDSDGQGWKDIDAINLAIPYTATTNGTAIIGGNADLWTTTAGFNQDIGINVVDVNALSCTGGGGLSPCQPVAWKESGGFAGTYSPNAAFVQTAYQMTAGHTYKVTLQWKANRQATGATIVTGAGPIGTNYSPTALSLLFVPSGTGVFDVVSSQQFSLSNNDGVSWQPIDPAGSLTASIPARANTCQALLSGNADLWTANPGYNQDIAIFVNGNLAGWKESGGFAGTFSPNAAFVQTVIPIAAGNGYQVQLEWKTNRSAQGATIYTGAGPIGSDYSPTRLTVQLVGC